MRTNYQGYDSFAPGMGTHNPSKPDRGRCAESLQEWTPSKVLRGGLWSYCSRKTGAKPSQPNETV